MIKYGSAVLLGVVCLLLGCIAAGGGPVVKAQATPEDGEWRMWSSPGDARYDSSGTWLYNLETGKVYGVTRNCGDDVPDGCLVPMPFAIHKPDYFYLPDSR